MRDGARFDTEATVRSLPLAALCDNAACVRALLGNKQWGPQRELSFSPFALTKKYVYNSSRYIVTCARGCDGSSRVIARQQRRTATYPVFVFFRAPSLPFTVPLPGVQQLVVESTKLKGVEDVPLLPLAGTLFEGKEFPTGEVAKKVRKKEPKKLLQTGENATSITNCCCTPTALAACSCELFLARGVVLGAVHCTTQEMREATKRPRFRFYTYWEYFITSHGMCCVVDGRLEGRMAPLRLACWMVLLKSTA